jgi:hypothetical protein
MTDQQDNQERPAHPGAFCAPAGATGHFVTGRGAICSSGKPGDRARWRASEPAKKSPGRGRRTPLGVIIPQQQIMLLPEAPPAPATAHDVKVTPVAGEQAFTVACTCGQSRLVRYARMTGEPVAHRLATIYGARHEENPADNPLTNEDPPILTGEDEVGQLLTGPPIEHVDTIKKLMGDVRRPDPVKPETWEELGRPQGPAPVGKIIGYMGGTYERLPGDPRRYRITSADGRDISGKCIDAPGRHQTADDARTVIRVDAFDHARIVADQGSQWRQTLGEVTGSWNYATNTVEGFNEATPKQREAITRALRHWTSDKVNTGDETRMAEPRVNTALRGGATLDTVAATDIDALDLAFTMSKTKKKITVYRGFTNGKHILPADAKTRDLTGLTWKTDGFTPVSADQDAADSYVGYDDDAGFGVRLHLPEGFPAIAIPDEIGGMDNEGEIVLPRGLAFRVTRDNGTSGEYNHRWLDVDVVLDQEPQPAAKAPSGWSNAARSRAARRFGRGGQGSNPLGDRRGGGRGYTEYEDVEFGGGRTQIWDKS